MALYRMAQNNYSEARLLWETNLSHADLSPHALNANTRWLAICLFEMGDIPRAKDLFTQLLKNSEDQHFLRARVSAEIYLSRIEMANGDLVPAQSRLKAAFDQAMSIGDRHACAEINEVSGKLHMELKEELEAAQSFRKALDDYERLGAVAQATEIRSALASLDTKSDSVVSVEAKV